MYDMGRYRPIRIAILEDSKEVQYIALYGFTVGIIEASLKIARPSTKILISITPLNEEREISVRIVVCRRVPGFRGLRLRLHELPLEPS
jgi:hypothetical protein